MEIPVNKILPNPEQPRKDFPSDDLRSLADSISANGIILPLAVEEAPDGFYILHDGERRLRAAKLAGLTTVPVAIVPGMDGNGNRERLIRALVANIQRANLSPIEEAMAYRRLIDEMGLSINAAAIRLGVSSSIITHRLELLKLDPEIQELVGSGKLPKGNLATKALLSIKNKDVRIKLAKQLADRYATERMVVDACSRMKQALYEPQFETSDIPAVRIANKKISIDHAQWDALAQIGKLPPWVLLETTTRETCKKCSWYGTANATICKDCPLPALLISIIGKATK